MSRDYLTRAARRGMIAAAAAKRREEEQHELDNQWFMGRETDLYQHNEDIKLCEELIESPNTWSGPRRKLERWLVWLQENPTHTLTPARRRYVQRLERVEALIRLGRLPNRPEPPVAERRRCRGRYAPAQSPRRDRFPDWLKGEKKPTLPPARPLTFDMETQDD